MFSIVNCKALITIKDIQFHLQLFIPSTVFLKTLQKFGTMSATDQEQHKPNTSASSIQTLGSSVQLPGTHSQVNTPHLVYCKKVNQVCKALKPDITLSQCQNTECIYTWGTTLWQSRMGTQTDSVLFSAAAWGCMSNKLSLPNYRVHFLCLSPLYSPYTHNHSPCIFNLIHISHFQREGM